MDIVFGNAKNIKKYLKNPNSFGHQMEKIITRRVAEIKSFPCLKELIKSGLGRCHPLHGELKGCFSVDLVHPQRLVFKPSNQDCIENGIINCEKVIAVEVVSIEDTH